MNPIPTETRLLGLTPHQYMRRMASARRDAERLRRAAIEQATSALAARVRDAIAALRAALRRSAPSRTVRA
jgi:hypothetical protein